MAEFSLIERYCHNIGASHPQTRLSVGDDAAVVQIPPGKELVISVDTMVKGVHFFADVEPAYLAHKLAAVNLSDMAAMGAEPKWATLALTLPNQDHAWLKPFSDSLNNIACEYGVELIGGDTTQGPLTLSMQIMGLADNGKALTRSNAQVGDDVYVSNIIGDAALALAVLQSKVSIDADALATLRVALEQPLPQVKLGRALVDVANACIDVSDGLIADLSHIANKSQVTIQLAVELVPVSKIYQEFIQQGGNLSYALSGGDDYQLAFTAAPEKRQEILKLAENLSVKISRVGLVKPRIDQSLIMQRDGEPFELEESAGYQHFA